MFSKLACAAVAACAIRPSAAASLYDIAKNSSDFSTLVSLIDATAVGPAPPDGPDLLTALSGDGNFTVFAPTNAVFDEQLSPEQLGRLKNASWQPQLLDFLHFHVLNSVVRFKDLSDEISPPTLVASSGEYINIFPDPPRISDRNASRDASVLVDDGLVDIEADNGVLHAIDSLMWARGFYLNVYKLTEFHYRGMVAMFQSVKKSSLETMLEGEDNPFTLFVPFPPAFEALPKGYVDYLYNPGNQKDLDTFVLHHIIPGNLIHSLLASGEVETLSGETVQVDVSEEGQLINGFFQANVKLNEASLTPYRDFIATNGVIHVVTAVLIPPSHAELVADFAAADAAAELSGETPDGDELKAGSYYLSHKINVPDGTTEDVCEGCSVTMELVYEGTGAWMGVGFSENGLMVGSEAVIGFPDSGTVEKHLLISNGKPASTLMEPTLIDASIEEIDGKTIMKFTKVMDEPGELKITPGDNTIVWAYGWGNDFGQHRHFGSSEIFLSSDGSIPEEPAEPTAEGPAEPSAEEPVDPPAEEPAEPLAEDPDEASTMNGSATLVTFLPWIVLFGPLLNMFSA